MGLLKEKRALITGGPTDLGLAVAERFRNEGTRMVITGRDRDLGARAEQALGPGVWCLVSVFSNNPCSVPFTWSWFL
jgi:NAD(P)-dependent dehydrogenase (short-subunit alcohol dehydrogenase family)